MTDEEQRDRLLEIAGKIRKLLDEVKTLPRVSSGVGVGPNGQMIGDLLSNLVAEWERWQDEIERARGGA